MRMNTKLLWGNLLINIHFGYHKGDWTMTLISQSIHHLLYINYIHIRFNKPTVYRICHQITQKYIIYMPYQSIPLSDNEYINTIWGIYTINVKSVRLEENKLAKTGHGPHSSKTVVLFYVLFVLYRSMYCLCVNVYCTSATGWQPNCS